MKIKDSGLKWFVTQYYPQHRTGRAVNMDSENGILSRLSEKEVIFFTPIGPRYDWAKRGTKVLPNHSEVQLLKFLKEKIYYGMEPVLSQKNFKWIFLGADTYGININNLPSNVVRNYFLEMKRNIEIIFSGLDISFELWSSYNTRAAPYRDAVRLNLTKYVPLHMQTRAEKVAEKMALDGNHLEYLIERVAEALLIDDLYHPIKISCVPRYKDDYVDVNLPRLYLVPPNNHAPWLGKHDY